MCELCKKYAKPGKKLNPSQAATAIKEIGERMLAGGPMQHLQVLIDKVLGVETMDDDLGVADEAELYDSPESRDE
jgi:hypothetical protein